MQQENPTFIIVPGREPEPLTPEFLTGDIVIADSTSVTVFEPSEWLTNACDNGLIGYRGAQHLLTIDENSEKDKLSSSDRAYLTKFCDSLKPAEQAILEAKAIDPEIETKRAEEDASARANYIEHWLREPGKETQLDEALNR